MGEEKRTKDEMLCLFKEYAEAFKKKAREMEKAACFDEMYFALGKAEAYGMAVFELECNMEG